MTRISLRTASLLAGAILLATAPAPEAQAFGGFLKNAVKNRAKRDAKRQAKKQVEQAVTEATGVDVNAVQNVVSDPGAAVQSAATEAVSEATGMDVSGMAQMASDPGSAAGGLASGAVPAALRPYLGKSKEQVVEALQAQIYAEKNLTRFSPVSKRRAAETQARSQAEDILSQLGNLPQGQGLAGQIAGTLNAAAKGAAEVVASGSSDVAGNREAVLAKVRAEVYGERGVSADTTGFKKTMADRIVDQRMKQLFGN